MESNQLNESNNGTHKVLKVFFSFGLFNFGLEEISFKKKIEMKIAAKKRGSNFADVPNSSSFGFCTPP